jgi:hypothetical protein
MLSWPRTPWQRGLLVLGLLIILLFFTVVWAVAAVFVAAGLWRGRSHPAVVGFLGGWLLVWIVYPLSIIDSRRVVRALRQGLPWPPPGKLSHLVKHVFFGGFAVAWCAGLVGLVGQGDIGGFASMATFTGLLVLGAIIGRIRREIASVDDLGLQVRTAYGPFAHTQRYELRLIGAPRAELESDSPYWNVTFEYAGKTVRFGRGLSEPEARARAGELSRLT